MTNKISLDASHRILILGCSGSGKSTLTRLISEKYDRPAVHLDVHFWKPNWVQTPTEQWREKVKKLVLPKSWVMDGTFSESFDLRFPAADLIIVVNLPRITCLYRAIKRVLKYSKANRRPDMADGCDETFDLDFYKYIWTYNKKVFPKVLDAIEKYDCKNKVIHLKTNQEVSRFIGEFL